MERKKLALVSLGHLSCDINGGALPACLPYIRAAHGLDYQATAGLMFAYSCLSSLIQPFFGLLADRHAKPWFIPLGIFLAGFGLTCMGFMAGYWAIFVSIAIAGIGSAFFHPEGARYANRVSGRQKGIGMSLFSIGGNSGFILGPLLVASAVGMFGLHGMVVFGIISGLMALVLLWQISHLPGAAPVAAAVPTARALAAEPQSAEGEELAASPVEAPGVNDWHGFSRLVVVILSRAIVFTGFNTFIPLYWVNGLEQSNAQGASALVIFGAFGVGCNILGGWLADRLSYVTVIRIAFCVTPLAAAAFALTDSLLASWALLPVMGFALYLPFSAQVVLGQKLLARNIGFASGVTLGLATTVGGIAQPMLGWIADTWALHAVFIALACVAALGCVFSFLLPRGGVHAR